MCGMERHSLRDVDANKVHALFHGKASRFVEGGDVPGHFAILLAIY
jgi:hypothetical protein